MATAAAAMSQQIEIVRERFDDRAHVVEAAGDEPLLQRGARDVEAPCAQRGRRRQRDDLDRLLRQPLDRAQHAPLARIDQRDRHALAADAAGAADAVHVDFGRGRDVVVDDVRDVIDVEAARRDVGGDEHVGLLLPEELHDAVALLLFHAAVERLRAVAVRFERVGQLVHLDARAAEDDRRRRVLEFEHARERVGLLRPRDDVGGLPHARQLAGRALLALDRHPCAGCLQVAQRDRAIRGAIVAAKSAVCRVAGVAFRIASRSSAKPMSSISSASSSTSTSSASSFSVCRRR